MQPPARQISTCTTCGATLEETFGGGGRCMSCLLQAGIGSEEETVHDSTPNSRDSGVRFGVYEIDCHADGNLCELGRGAMGVTYRATDTSLQRKVALKIIKTDIAEGSADARERFVREARAAAALRHENIATVYQFGMRQETAQYFYAMELIEGESLDERVHRAGPLDARTTIGIAEQVTSALAAAEKHGLVHRDLKPANLMLVNADDPEAMGGDQARSKRSRIRALRKSGIPVVKIIDFGLAKAFYTTTDPKSLTHDRFVGTPAFASPEQFDHSALDVRSDIYSLGETLWFTLTGKAPFAGRTLSEIHRAQKSKALPTEQLKAAHVPSSLRSLLESMLAFEPACRPGTQELTVRLQRCSPEVRSVRRTRAALALAAIVVLALSALFAVQQVRIQDVPINPAPEKSIAVLPFENLSSDQENAFFADGVQDEILTDLAKVADLKVISRTSVMQYKSGAERNLREIAKALGVANVVEGSVQRSGNRVRVSAQLIDARMDTHVWAERYDRDLANVFAIQSEIAKTIADQLQAKIAPKEIAAIEKAPTTDLVAYDFYSRARALWGNVSDPIRSRENLTQIVRLLDEAVARDPNFLLAWCLLSRTHGAIYRQGYDRTSARLSLADAARQTALRLQPDAGEAHLASAIYYYYGFRDYDRARTELAVAGRTLPNSPEVFQYAGLIDRRQGHWAEATRNLERALELDPRNLFILQQLALTYAPQRRYDDEARTWNRCLTIVPGDPLTSIARARVALNWRADTKPSQQILTTLMSQNPAVARDIDDPVFALCERTATAAARALANYPPEGVSVDGVNLSHAYWKGVFARCQGDLAQAQSAFNLARSEVASAVEKQPNFATALSLLAVIDAGLGRKNDAIREGRRACELLPISKDAIDGVALAVNLAKIYAWTGEKDLAIEQIAAIERVPNPLSYGLLKLQPYWDPLRGDPRFEKIVASLAPGSQ
jgi:serine/threonine protein kinase/Flp pilus assembly protein TadD